jgi:hypothetical protein
MSEPFDSFSAFYPVYLRMHDHPMNRRLHVAGNLLGLGAIGPRAPSCYVGGPLSKALRSWDENVLSTGNQYQVLRTAAQYEPGSFGHTQALRDASPRAKVRAWR